MAAAGNHTPVLIVVGGPVGLALAGDLGWRGVPCILIEKTDGVVVQPKMDLVGVRTMEFCRRWGIVDWVESCPYPRDYKQDYVYVTTLTGYELGREPFPSLGDEKPPPQSPQKRERCPQDMFDPILKRFAASFAHVELNYETELIGLEQTQERVIATVAADGETRKIAASYVIGADGGASTVRSLAGITMSGNAVLTYTTNAIIRSSALRSVHNKGDAYRFIFIGPEGTWATIVAIDGRDRYRFSLIGSMAKKTYSEQEIRDAVVKAVGVDFEFDIESVLSWVRRELVADSYVAGRIYIAGDAAHLMSPTGGFGMNTGIADSVDLGWKLAAVTEGWGGPQLLASYEVERRPVALRNVHEASGNLNRMLSNRDQRPPATIFTSGPEGDRDRAEYGANFAANMRREWFTMGVHLGFFYEGSPICWPDGTPPPLFELADYKPTARPGSRAPHAWIGPHRSTLDLFGRGFTLLQLASPAMDAPRLQEAAAQRGVPLTTVNLSDERASELYARRLVLVRPDGHVAWRGDSEPDDAGAVIDVVSGRRSYADVVKPDAHARMKSVL